MTRANRRASNKQKLDIGYGSAMNTQPVWVGHIWLELSGLVWFGIIWFGMDEFGLVWLCLVWYG